MQLPLPDDLCGGSGYLKLADPPGPYVTNASVSVRLYLHCPGCRKCVSFPFPRLAPQPSVEVTREAEA